MVWYYVKSGGTATGDGGRYTSQKTGSWATAFSATSEYYSTIENALGATTSPASGDFILVSEDHSHSQGSTITWSFPTAGQVIVACVDDSNVDQSTIAVAAQETATGSNIFSYSGKAHFYGMYLSAGKYFNNAADGSTFFSDCTFAKTTSNEMFDIRADGNDATFINCTFSSTNASAYWGKPSNGATIRIYGGALSGSYDDFFSFGFTGAGNIVECFGLDLSPITGYLLGNVGANAADDVIRFSLQGCKLNGSLTGVVEETFISQNHRFDMYNSSSTSGSEIHQFHVEGFGGYVDDQDDSGIHRDESTGFADGTKVSAHCVTNPSTTRYNPFWFELPSRYAELSTTDTLRFYLASTTSLTDVDVWVSVLYSDGTNKNTYNRISTKASDFIGTGTPLTTDSGSTWKNGVSDLTGYNEYQIDVDTSGAGADSVPIIRIYVGLASVVVYFDTTVDVV